MSSLSQQSAAKARPKADLSAMTRDSVIRDTYRISYLANNLVLPVYDRILKEFGLNRGEYLLIYCLCHYDRLTAQDVAEMTARPRNTISRAVHRMLADGYLSRTPDPEDGRQIYLHISEQGRALNKRIEPLFKEREEKILSPLTEKDRADLNRILKKIVG